MTPEYFSALNEEEAKKYIGKIMEFADVYMIRQELIWIKRRFICLTGIISEDSKSSFQDDKGFNWQFMRTCPETFKPEKKTLEGWINVYPSGYHVYHDSKEEADADANRDRRITCLHIKQGYEVDE